MITSNSILITGGIGDWLTIDAFLTDADRAKVKTIYYATRAGKEIRDILQRLPIWNGVRNHNIIERDYTKPIHRKEELSGIGSNVQDMSIDVMFPKLYCFKGGSVTRYKLYDTYKTKDVVIHPWSDADTRFNNRQISAWEWEGICNWLDNTQQHAVVIGIGKGHVPTHPRLWNLVNETSLRESIEIVKAASTFIGVDSWAAILAAQDPKTKLHIKSTNRHLYNWKATYYAPRTVFDFLATTIEFKPSKDEIRFCHSGNVGDVIHALPSVKDIVKRRGFTKANLYLKIDAPAQYHPGLIHPCGRVQMNREFAESIMPLLKLQPYLEVVKIHEGEKIDVDLDGFRRSGFNHAMGDISRYCCHTMHCQPVTWEAWLECPGEPNDLILINRTQRYHNPRIDYRFMEQYDNVFFVGLEQEFDDFKKLCCVPWLKTDNFYDLACMIHGCKLFVGNQSTGFALAQSMMVPRVLEICPMCPNVIVNGPRGYDAWDTSIMRQAVDSLLPCIAKDKS